MIRLLQILIVITLLVTLVSADDEGTNSSDEYTVQELVIFSFDEAQSPDPGNGTPVVNNMQTAGNQADLGGEMTARKLFRLREAAKADYRKIENQSDDGLSGLSPTSSQKVSIICKQCIPTKTTEI